jgi:hypothetical protein
VRRLLVAANVPSSPILVILMKEALGSSETSVLTRATRRNIPEDTILYLQKDEGLLMWGAFSGERTGRCFVVVAGPRQRSLFSAPSLSGHFLKSETPQPAVVHPFLEGRVASL